VGKRPSVSFIYVNYNSTQLLLCSLQSLRLEEGDEIIIIDNASREDTSILDRFRRVKLIRNRRNRGFAGAVNQGLKMARGDYIALVNPDTVLFADTVDRLVDFMEKNPEAGAVSPQLLYPDFTPQDSARRFPRLKYLLSGRRSFLTKLFPRNPLSSEFLYKNIVADDESPMEVESILGTFMFLRREVLEGVGLLDEGFFFFGEDLDFCKRLWDAGWKVYLHRGAKVIHYHGMSRKKLRFRTEWEKARSARRFISKHQKPSLAGRVILDLGLSFYLLSLALKDFLGLFTSEPYWKWRV